MVSVRGPWPLNCSTVWSMNAAKNSVGFESEFTVVTLVFELINFYFHMFYPGLSPITHPQQYSYKGISYAFRMCGHTSCMQQTMMNSELQGMGNTSSNQLRIYFECEIFSSWRSWPINRCVYSIPSCATWTNWVVVNALIDRLDFVMNVGVKIFQLSTRRQSKVFNLEWQATGKHPSPINQLSIYVGCEVSQTKPLSSMQ